MQGVQGCDHQNTRKLTRHVHISLPTRTINCFSYGDFIFAYFRNKGCVWIRAILLSLHFKMEQETKQNKMKTNLCYVQGLVFEVQFAVQGGLT